jgi:hypothetical protein
MRAYGSASQRGGVDLYGCEGTYFCKKEDKEHISKPCSFFVSVTGK